MQISAEIDFPRGGVPKVLRFRTSQHQQQGKIGGGEAVDEHGNEHETASSNSSSKQQKGRGNKRMFQQQKTGEKAGGTKKFKTDEAEDAVDRTYEQVFRQTMNAELLAQNLRGLAFVKYIDDLAVTMECVDGIRLTLAADAISRVFSAEMANTEASLRDIFQQGQALAFKLLEGGGGAKRGGGVKRKNQPLLATTCPYEVNRHLLPSTLLAGMALNGIVLSKEEKGAIIDLGFATSSARGFVHKDDLPAYLALERLHVGQIDDLAVTMECVDGIRLTLAADAISRVFSAEMANTEASLRDIFQQGQALAFKLLEGGGGAKRGGGVKRKNQPLLATTCPYEVNRHLLPSTLLAGMALNGIVLSKEEKGAIIDLGFATSSARGFVHKDDLPAYLALERLHVGQVALFRVKDRPAAGAEARVIKLSAFLTDSLELAEDGGGQQVLDGKQLMPGTIVEVLPEKAVYDGIFVGIPNGPKAYIRKCRLPPRLQVDQGRLAATKTLRACVLCSHPNTPMPIVLSAHPDIVTKTEKRSLPEEYKIGSRITGIVTHVDRKQNVFFKLAASEDDEADNNKNSSGDKQTMLTAKCLRVKIENAEENIHKFTVGSEHQCRVVGYSAVDRLLLVSTLKADLDRKQVVVSAEEAEPGTKLRGTVRNVRPTGLAMDFGDGLRGWVSAMHTLDQPSPDWQRRFQRGQPLVCRVLFANTTSNRLMLTAKRAMVRKEADERLVTGFDKQLEGCLATGVVIKHFDAGSLLIAFFNRVAGILNPSNASKLPPESTQIGQSIRVRIRSVDPAMERMELEVPDEEFQSSKSAKGSSPADAAADVALGIEKRRPKSPKKPEALSKLVKHAKPFRVYTAKVVGPWPYGGTAAETTAELLLPGGGVGRLHVSELNNNSTEAEGTAPMQQFLARNQGKSVTVKVLCVSKHKAITKPGRELLMERRESDRVVECTAKALKVQETRKKLSLLNYRAEFGVGNLVPVYTVGNSATPTATKGFRGEINPDFSAVIPRDQISIGSIVERIKQLEEQQPSVEVDCVDLFAKGELRYGRVLGVNKTKRGNVVMLQLVEGGEAIGEQMGEETAALLEKRGKRKRRNTSDTAATEEEDEQMQQEKVEVKKEVEGHEEDEQRDDDDNEEEVEVEEGVDEKTEEEKLEILEPSATDGETLGSVDDYERAVVAHPGSVPLWIGFISHWTSSNKKGAKGSARKRYEQGKAVAERALKAVTFQNDTDLASMWKAYLQLEVLLGSADTLREAFKRACAASQSYEMHMFLIQLLKRQPNAEGREEEIRAYFDSMIAKFKGNVDMLEPWFAYAQHLMQRDDAAESRQLLKRALQCCPKRKHLTILNKFIQLEERFGDRERAKTMQEVVNNCREHNKQQQKSGDGVGDGTEKQQLDMSAMLERTIGGVKQKTN